MCGICVIFDIKREILTKNKIEKNDVMHQTPWAR